MPYKDLRLSASPKPSYEDPRLPGFTCTIPCKPFFRSLHNCLINRFPRKLKPEPHLMCNPQELT